jgi:hypothetical protein
MAKVPKLEKVAPLVFDAVMMMRLVFSGSFQCRLATEGDGTDYEPTDRKGVYGKISVGQTFAFREAKFDRVIRFCDPVTLRNALMDPWEDVRVTGVEVNTTRAKLTMGGGGRLTPTGDPLLGNVVSLGKKTMFDTAAGRANGGREAILGLSLSIGGGLFTAEGGDPAPVAKTLDQGLNAWTAEYQTRKPQLIKEFRDRMDPVRRDHMEELREDGDFRQIQNSSYEFYLTASYIGPLKNVRCNINSKFNPKNWIDIPFDWTIDLTFFRYDHDTLTGRVEGQIYATAKR